MKIILKNQTTSVSFFLPTRSSLKADELWKAKTTFRDLKLQLTVSESLDQDNWSKSTDWRGTLEKALFIDICLGPFDDSVTETYSSTFSNNLRIIWNDKMTIWCLVEGKVSKMLACFVRVKIDLLNVTIMQFLKSRVIQNFVKRSNIFYSLC